jgi:hypothetical protein
LCVPTVVEKHHYCFHILHKAEELTALHRGIRVLTLKYDCDLLLVLMNINTNVDRFRFDINLFFIYDFCHGMSLL